MRDPADSTAAVFKDERKRSYLNPEGADRPLRSPIPADVVDRARRYRMERLRMAMAAHEIGALLLYDPVNIRYAFDCSNMSIWTMHNPSRYALIVADGPAVMFEFEGAEHVNDGLPASMRSAPRGPGSTSRPATKSRSGSENGPTTSRPS